MRLLFICPGFDEQSIVAQPWRHSYEIARNSIFKQNEIAFITDIPFTCSLKETTIRGLHTYILPKQRHPPFMFPVMNPCDVKSVIKDFAPDAIYWDGSPISGNYIRRLKNINIPIVLHISTNIYRFEELYYAINGFYWSSSYFLFLMMSSPLLNHYIRMLNQKTINIITVPNPIIKDRLMQRGVNGDKIKVLPVFNPFNTGESISEHSIPGMNMRIRAHNPHEELELDFEDFLVTYFGPPPTYRGTDTLIHALDKLRSKLPELKLLMLLRQRSKKEDVFERRLKHLSKKLGLDKRVKFLSGFLDRQDLNKLLQTSDAIALPFKFIFHEPVLSILEAMSMGKPVITTRVSGSSDLLNNGRGLLVDPGNSNQLADAIYHIAKNPDHASSLSRTAKEYFLTLPKWGDLSDYVIDLINSIL
ncbi:glycosyltransferase [Candidatus Dojkabacteria bacterium]|nr:glycosyltransferase [Candidatus Dojkabacteria bacterium]